MSSRFGTCVRTLVVVLTAAATVAATAAPGLSPGDIHWLDRVTFGVTAASVAHYREVGRARFLDEQLHPPASDPDELAARIRGLTISQQSAADRVKANQAEQARINALPTDEEKQQARTVLNQTGNTVVYETMKRHLSRAIESPWQLREQMTWFWMNHFNVFQGKANVRWTLAEYEEQAIRTHAFAKFSDLVMATVTSPAMLEYLDNAQSAVGKINENYARELMELHTLGVSGGASGSRYTQTDVQELARLLTGVGVNFSDKEPNLPPARRGEYVHRGLFEFNPVRHDVHDAAVLGHTFHGDEGLGEVERAVRFLCEQPATGRFISRKLATYFIADDPPQPIVDRMAATFDKTGGSIAAVLGEMFTDRDVSAALNRPTAKLEKFKDPVQFVVSSLRLAYEGKTLTNYRPMTGWLQQLGEPLYGHVTPDGYALTESAWTSSGQMIQRFEIARAIGSGNAGLFNGDDNKPGPTVGFPLLTTRLYYDAIEPALGQKTRDALSHTASQQEWNTILLASPDWMLR
jgi:uncharacterized protein (DUF1800 family)